MDAEKYESVHVQSVYDAIAPHFSQTVTSILYSEFIIAIQAMARRCRVYFFFSEIQSWRGYRMREWKVPKKP